MYALQDANYKHVLSLTDCDYAISCTPMHHCCTGYGRELKDGDDQGSFSGRSSEDEGIYPRGMSLEKATERLLAWPPIGSTHAMPHASVLERRQDVILKNLRERTVPVVSLKEPHILVCSQSNWPQHLFFFLRELRKLDQPNPPIVILYPNDPTAKEWGKVGIFKDVFFLKGSPMYELDLMRGGVLQAGPSTKLPISYFILTSSTLLLLMVVTEI